MNSIDSATMIPIGIVVAVLIAVVGVVWRAANILSEIKSELKGLREDFGAMLSRADFKDWAWRLDKRNPDIDVPKNGDTNDGHRKEKP